MKMSKNMSIYNIQNYNVFHNSRISRGGGVSIYIRSRYIACRLSEMCIMHQSIETVFVKVSINSRDFVIGCIYRPPKSDCNLFYSKIEDLLYCVARNHGGSTLILHGDFNLDLLQNNIRSTFLPVMLGNNLYPLILRPTRVQGQSATLIDNIFCNNLNLLSGSGIYTTDISDHFAIQSVPKKCTPFLKAYISYEYACISKHVCCILLEILFSFFTQNFIILH